MVAGSSSCAASTSIVIVPEQAIWSAFEKQHYIAVFQRESLSMRQHRVVSSVEKPLAGGMDNAGAVVRIGDTVRRPTKKAAVAVRALLLHLEDVGFEGAPRYLGTDEQGREVLSYIEGQAPLPPYPAWSMSDDALVEVAGLLRRFHEAAASLDPRQTEGWATEWADPMGGPLVCHNDPYPENVLFHEGRAVALIDFDLAAPGRS